MQAYRVETTIEKDGSVTLQHLPFEAGESIEVIVLARAAENPSNERYPLRGTVLKYTDPLEPMAEEDWAIYESSLVSGFPCFPGDSSRRTNRLKRLR